MQRLSNSQVEAMLGQARIAFNRGDIPAASRQIETVLQSRPDSSDAHLAKGIVLLAQGSPMEALNAFILALRSDPTGVEALRRAAVTALNLGRPAEAEAFIKRLIRIQPNDGRTQFQLANALALQNRFQEALDALERSLSIQPEQGESILLKARLLGRMNLPSLSIEWYRKALAIHHLPQIAIELSELLLNEGEVEEALATLGQIEGGLPQTLQAQTLMAKALTEAREFELAGPHWAWVDSATGRRESALTRANTEILVGRLGIAEDLLREAIQHDPSAPGLYRPLASIRKIGTADQPLVESMENLIASGNLNPSQIEDLRYGLGKAYHDLGEFGKAIHNFDEANRLAYEASPTRQNFSPERWKSYIDIQIEFFTKDRIQALSREGLDDKEPLFIVGMIRSGTTLCEQILSCHSQIASGGERSFWADRRDEVFNPRSRQFDISAAKRLGRAYLKTRDNSSAEYLIDKYPSNLLIGGTLHCVFPNTRMIHVKRHPVDNLLSIWMTPINTTLPFVSHRENLVFAYQECMRLAKHLEEVLPKNRFQACSYEALTSDPSATVEKLLHFLDLDSEAGCLSPEKNPRTVRTPSVYQVRQPINTDSQEKWKLYEPWLGPFKDLLEN